MLLALHRVDARVSGSAGHEVAVLEGDVLAVVLALLAGEAKVYQLDPLVLLEVERDHHVLGLEVFVHVGGLVELLQGLEEGETDIAGRFKGELVAAQFVELGQRLELEIGDEVALGAAPAEDGHIGVVVVGMLLEGHDAVVLQ